MHAAPRFFSLETVRAPTVRLPPIPQTARGTYGRFLTEAPHSSFTDVINPKLRAYRALLRCPGADIAFLRCALLKGGLLQQYGAHGVAKLKTTRTFHILTDLLEGHGFQIRSDAITLLGAFAQPRCVPVLLRLIRGRDENQGLCWDGLEALRRIKAPGINTKLKGFIKRRPTLAAAAEGVLAEREFPAPLRSAFAYLMHVRKFYFYRKRIAAAVVENHPKAVVGEIIKLYRKWQVPSPNVVESPDRMWSVKMAMNLLFSEVCAPMTSLRPGRRYAASRVEPSTANAWSRWWSHAASDFDSHLRVTHAFAVKLEAERPKKYPNFCYGHSRKALSMGVRLNHKTYGPKEPIVMRVTFRNHSHLPCRVVLPNMPSIWNRTMGFGFKIRDVKSGKVVYFLAPSASMSVLSYCPPRLRTLPPGNAFKQRISLQSFLSWEKVFPLKPGTYRFTFTFDSRDFNGIRPVPPEILGRWKAKPVTFTIKNGAGHT